MDRRLFHSFKYFLVILLIMGITTCEKAPSVPARIEFFDQGTWIDLTYPFDENTVYWPSDTLGFMIDTVSYGVTDQDYFYAAFSFCSAEHGGTHLDAPVHFAEGMKSVEALTLDQLIGRVVIIDVSTKALENRDYLVSIEDFLDWEKKHGPLPTGSIILLRTGYGKFWPDREDYLGTSRTGSEAVAFLHFPGLDPEAALWLTKERSIKAIGLDTPSIDYGQSGSFESHRILFAHDIPAFENLANLDQLPTLGAWIVALPMSISGGSGAPLRAVAWIPLAQR
jgi:kynurenine formamidase